MKKSVELVAIVTLILASAFGCASSISPVESGSDLFKVKHQNVQIPVGKQGNGYRLVDVSITYPVGEGQFPLIAFSHGHALDNQSYFNLADYWAARGYVIAAPMHLDSGGDLQATSLVTKKVGSDWIAASRLYELKAVIDQISNITSTLSDFSGQVSTDKVIAAGHSYGALSSQQLSGAKVELQKNSIYPIVDNFLDERVVAVVAISPPGLMKDHLTEATWKDYSTPQLVITGTNDFFPRIWPDYKDHFISYSTAKEGSNYLLVLDGMDHYLGNLIGRLEREQEPQNLSLKHVQEFSLQFIQSHLLDDKSFHSEFTSMKRPEGVLKLEHR